MDALVRADPRCYCEISQSPLGPSPPLVLPVRVKDDPDNPMKTKVQRGVIKGVAPYNAMNRIDLWIRELENYTRAEL